ncbi:unnamed protein product [Lepeophtheirus salmonis]|uniref:(salmon louse) hypothetical protein n=1 Tax=Lepeophtheirus salmonis TaxID=72036 RepID=A0A7R8CEL0_LEPSM|nr:unnamed protein product [Lepeophtheirus salmonis]CAF2791984.1 unnamed protein product [Lepeophtheirus salmonis]
MVVTEKIQRNSKMSIQTLAMDHKMAKRTMQQLLRNYLMGYPSIKQHLKMLCEATIREEFRRMIKACVSHGLGISGREKTPLIFIQFAVKDNAQNYLENVLEAHVKPRAEYEFGNNHLTFQ